MRNYNYIIAITGKSASGKSSIEQILEKEYGYKRVVSTTTRPMRSNEINHVDYHFISDREFQQLIDEDKLIEYRYYNTITNDKPTRWQYGIEKNEIDLSKHNYVVVVDLKGLEDLKKEFGYRVISIYIDVPEEIRKTRAIARDRYFEENEWDRRSKDDNFRFANVKNVVDAVIKNYNFDECLSRIIYYINETQKQRTFFTQYVSW